MILFIFGENSYGSWEKLEAIKQKYIAANFGDTDLITLNGKEITYKDFAGQIMAMPFLAKNRLVIVKNILDVSKELREKIVSDIKKNPASTILIFYENKLPDQRTKEFKTLKKIAKCQEFKLPDIVGLKKWIHNQFLKYNQQINPDAIDELAIYVGPDLWRMENEIKKLCLYKMPLENHKTNSGSPMLERPSGTSNSRMTSNNTIISAPHQVRDKLPQEAIMYVIPAEAGIHKSLTITKQDVINLVRPKINSNIFDLVDAIASKNQSRAVSELYKLHKNSVFELVIFTMISRQFKNLLIIKELNDQQVNNFTIAKLAGIHPFVVKKTIPQLKHYTLDELKNIYQKILHYDAAFKQGKINVKLGLEKLIYDVARKNAD